MNWNNLKETRCPCCGSNLLPRWSNNPNQIYKCQNDSCGFRIGHQKLIDLARKLGGEIKKLTKNASIKMLIKIL